MSDLKNIQEAIELLTKDESHRVIKLLQAPQYHPDVSRAVICVIIDSEATSSDSSTAVPIELGMLKIGFNPGDRDSIVAIDRLEMLNDPGVESTDGAQAAHGIPPEDLIGKKFDLPEIERFLKGVDFIIAHNAGYDRPVLSREIPIFNDMKWLCSMKEVPWSDLGISSRSLDYLIYKAGYFHKGHRALADCEALLAVLSHEFLGGEPPLFILDQGKNEKHWSFMCIGAPFDAKEIMKKRGYRWNPGDTPGDAPIKCWSTPELKNKQALLDELIWLSTNVYENPLSFVNAMPMTSDIRYSQNAKAKSYEKITKVEILKSINKMKLDLSD